KRVVCVWSESVRHGSKKNGYHGGVSAQEVVVPLSVFAPMGVEIPEWRPAPPIVPEWWSASIKTVEVVAPPVAPIAKPGSKKPSVPSAQVTLFDNEEPVSSEPTTGAWIEQLLASPTYASQKRLAARVAPQDDQVKALLDALQSRGGKLAKAVVAQRLSMPELRISGFVMAAR